jgi:hypothetical protein
MTVHTHLNILCPFLELINVTSDPVQHVVLFLVNLRIEKNIIPSILVSNFL